MSQVVAGPIDCPNCGRQLDGAYCARCGQKATPVNPTLSDFVRDFAHELLDVDGRIFRSIRLLLTRPGFLTREFFDGRRARYLSPVRLYLLMSVAYFAIAAIAPAPRPGRGIQIDVTGDDAYLRELGFDSEQQVQETVRRAVNTWGPRVMFVLVPLFAWLVKGVTRGTGRNYPQHLYFALHLHAGAFAFLSVGAIGQWGRGAPYVEEAVGMTAMLLLLAYSVAAFHRAYGGSTGRAIVRTAVVGSIYLVAIGLAIATMLLPVLLRLYRVATGGPSS